MSLLPGRALVLIGFMGAGKSTVARGLAADALDTDTLIEAKAGAPVSQIFERDGEAAFRQLEESVVLEALEQAAKGAGSGIVSLGGGALGAESVREALGAHTTVLLDVGADRAWERVRHSDRPLATNRDAFVALFEERRPLYRSVADVIVPADGPPALRSAMDSIKRLDGAPDGTRLLWATSTGGDYPVYTGSGLLGTFSPGVSGREVLITDSVVGRQHAEGLGQEEMRLEFPAGEENKTVATCEMLWQSMAKVGVSRADHVVAIGGGVVGDVAGFAAATYQRGIPVVHWPTTLVAQVDSAYGGKTGVDLPQGKNYVGSFHQPAAVVTDVSLLETLPAAEISAGMAEVIKTALIAGGELWQRVKAGEPIDADLITSCALTKLGIVAADERDGGARQLLNLGHTVGHAIETATSYARLRHGEAVGIGLLAALRLSGAGDLRDEVEGLLVASGLPTSVDGVDPRLVCDLVAKDKKSRGDGIVPFVFCERPGQVSFGNLVDESSLAHAVGEVVS